MAVFSAVGVGALVAAALVLAFLVPADPGLVRITLLGVTAASAAATLLLRRRRPVSAAAIAAGTALLCLLVIALFVRWLPPQELLLAAAAAVAGLAVGLGVAGFGLRLRPWVSAAMLLAPISAALAAGGLADRPWWADVALVAAIAVAAAGRWAARRWQGEQPGGLPFGVERALLGLGAAVALLLAVATTFWLATDSDERSPLAAGLMLAIPAAAWLHGTKPDVGWRRVAGMVAVLAPVVLVLGLRGDGLLATAAAGLGWIALALLSSLPALRAGRWSGLLQGGWVAALLLTLPAVGYLLLGAGEGSGRRLDDVAGFDVLMLGWELPAAGFAAAGLVIAAAQCAIAATLPPARFGRMPDPTGAPLPELAVIRLSGWLWPWLALAGLAATVALPLWPLEVSVLLLLALALAAGLVAWRVGEQLPPVRAAGRTGGGLLIIVAVLASWDSRPLTLTAGALAVLLAIGWTQLVPRAGRPVLAGLAYGYALTLLGFALHWYPLGWPAGEWTPVAGLLAVAASLVSLSVLAVTPRLAALRPPRPGPPSGPAAAGPASPPPDQPTPPGLSSATGFTLLGLGLVPWLLAVLTVLEDRTWWAAAAATGILAVELAVTARRRPQPSWLRVIAAASLLPTVGIWLVNAGGMLIPTSGSPILLPIVAALAAFTAITAAYWAGRIERFDARAARPIRGAFEGGALLTALAAVGLAIVLPATGPTTTLVVCAILAAGGSVVATQPDRRWVWWLVALAASGVLWSALVLFDVGLVEAYTLPIGVAAAIVGLLLTRRRPRWWTLVAAGLQLSLLPSWLLAATGRDLLLRAAALTAAALGLAAIALLARRPFETRPSGDLRDRRIGDRRGADRRWQRWVLASGLLVAGTAPLLVAARSSGRIRPVDPLLERLLAGLAGAPLAGFAWVVATALVSAGMLALAGQLVRWATAGQARWRPVAASWRFAPALTVVAAGFALAVRPGQPVVLAMWLACLGFLAITVVATRLRLRGRVILPPVWYVWLLALGVGIAGWSLRQLRVEFHALPLGLTLLACGVLAWRAAGRATQSLPDRSWPIGQTDPTVAILPGVLATLGPSTLAISTDPQTWRAILVLVLALAALLVGARKLWRPCMVTGIVDLAVAVLLVFVARRGSIDAIPWLIALVSAGGVLLGLAVYSERRQHSTAAKPQ